MIAHTGTFQPFRTESGIFCWGFLWLPWESTKENHLPAGPGTFPGSPGPNGPCAPPGVSPDSAWPKSLFLGSVGTFQPHPLSPGPKHTWIQQLPSLSPGSWQQAQVHRQCPHSRHKDWDNLTLSPWKAAGFAAFGAVSLQVPSWLLCLFLFSVDSLAAPAGLFPC